MTHVIRRDEQAPTSPGRYPKILSFSRPIRTASQTHILPFAILGASTLVLFRTWLSARYPGGTDSAFLYSGVTFYKSHDLKLFNVWLPTPLGQISQYSMYWLLSMLVAVFGHTLLTYKLIAISIALGSTFSMYFVSWSWSRSRLGALAAAVAYSFSPMSLAQWLSGHLDVQLSMAVGPLMIWSICRLFDTGSMRAALGLGLCGSALLLLTTGQTAYWILPVLVIIAGKLPMSFRKLAHLLRRVLPGTITALTVFVACSVVQLGPWLIGVHAAFAGSQTLAIEDLSIHAKYSLGFSRGIIGVPGETWLLPGAKVSSSSFASLLYIIPQIAILLFAARALFRRRDPLPRVFLVLALSAWFIESGPFGPMGSVYVFLWQHIAYFRELRVPGRWQMISTFAVASMLAISIAESANQALTSSLRWRYMQRRGRRVKSRAFDDWLTFLRRFTASRSGPHNVYRMVGYSGLLILVSGSLLALNGGTILSRGLPTINPPPAFVSAYSALARSPGDWRVLTVPFGQAWMAGPAYGDYEGVIADLGYTSSLYDDRSVLGNGGWDPRASQFVTFLEDVVNQGTDLNLAGLLGAAGVKYIVLNPEPAVGVPAGQANLLRSEHGFRVIRSGHGETVLENQLAQQQVSQPTKSCVIAGGYPVLEDLTGQAGFSFSNTALYFADQLVKTSGWPTLIQMVKQSHCLIMGPGAQAELTVLRDSASSVQAISIAPSQWDSGQISPLLDSQADPANWVRIPAGRQLTWTANAPSAGYYRVWARIMRGPDTTSIPIKVNGVAAGSVTPSAPATLGFQWLPAKIVRLRKGAARVVLRGTGNAVSPQLAEVALVHTGSVKAGLVPGVKSSWLIVDRESFDAGLYRHPRVEWSRPITSSHWRQILGVKIAHGHRRMITLSPTSAKRSRFAMAYAALPGKIDAGEPVAFKFRGTGSGATFYLNFYFRDGSKKSFSFEDVTSRRRLLFFTPQEGKAASREPSRAVTGNPYLSSLPHLEVPDWSKLRYLTLSSNSRVWRGGPIKISGLFPIRLLHVVPYFVGHFPVSGSRKLVSGAKLGAQMVSSTAAVHDLQPGILDFSQSYDPQWDLTGARASVHTVELGFENSYLVNRAGPNARLTYKPATVGMWGTVASAAAWFLGLASLSLWPLGTRILRRRRKGYLVTNRRALDGSADRYREGDGQDLNKLPLEL